MTGKLIGYVRVSSIDQNIDRQLDGLKLDKVFTDKCSGKDTKRPQLALMLEYAREDDTIIVHSMDRLARNLDDLRSIVQKLTKAKIKVKFVKENLEFSGENSPMANLLLSVMGAFAEFERALIKERQAEGIAIAKKAGKYKGRSKCLTEEQTAKIRQMVADRYKKTDIAKQFEISRDTLYRYLNNGVELITPELELPKTIQVKLCLYIENNSDFVRGKKKSRESIELLDLDKYDFEKTDECEYILTVPYKNDTDLDETMEELLSDMASTADTHSCHIDATLDTLDGSKQWECSF